ncbi:MAG: hypothetical protein KGN84_04010 [Acidobacteriota bacterium]|nr:hypothetical protein [Acidobacteriota bacterium]
MRAATSSLLKPVLRHAARAYVTGSQLGNAVDLARSLADRGFAGTIGFWDSPRMTEDRVAREYRAVADSIAELTIDCTVSIKPPSIGFGGDVVAELLAQGGNRTRVHFDSLSWEQAESSFRLLYRHSGAADRLGCTLPSRWRRSLQDAAAIRDRGYPVRIVKGQWAAPAAFEQEPSAGMLELARRFAGYGRTVAIASHDAAAAQSALSELKRSGTPAELQLLYGMPWRRPLQVARETGVPVRFYLPYGHAWLPYALRQAMRKPRIVYWMLRDAFATRGVPDSMKSSGGSPV